MNNQTDTKFLDISKLLSGEIGVIPFDSGEIPFPNESDEISVSSLHFSGTAKDVSGFIRLIGSVQGKYSAPCGRCLAPVTEDFTIELDYAVVTVPTDSEEETVVAEGQKIDLAALAEEAVLLNRPLRLLCREDCKGLCPKCGKNLNTDSCLCQQKEIDPRLAGLADFFKD